MLFKTRTLVITAIVVIVISGLLYGYLYIRDRIISYTDNGYMLSHPIPPGYELPSPIDNELTPMQGGPVGKVAASQTPDGTYVATIRSVMTTPEDMVLTFTPVSTTGSTTKETGEPDFMAPATANTTVSLIGNAHATTKDLTALVRTEAPVFDVTIVNGNISSVVERESVLGGKR